MPTQSDATVSLLTFTDLNNRQLRRYLYLIEDEIDNEIKVNLSAMHLNRIPSNILIEKFKKLSPTLKELDLSSNELSSFPALELISILQATPSQLQTLSLSWNNLNELSADELACIFKMLAKQLTVLKLAGNDFNTIGIINLVKIIKALSANINTLDMSFNHLSEYKPEELAQLFKAYPSNLIFLNLSDNKLDTLDETVLNKLLLCLPPNVHTVFIDNKSINMNALRNTLFIEKIDQEIKRLSSQITAKGNLLVTMGLISSSDAKIKALEELKFILEHRTNENESANYKKALIEWTAEYKDLMGKQRNKIHGFFSSHHTPTSCQIITQVESVVHVINTQLVDFVA